MRDSQRNSCDSGISDLQRCQEGTGMVNLKNDFQQNCIQGMQFFAL